LVHLLPGLDVAEDMTGLAVGQRLLQMPLLLVFYMILSGLVLIPAQSSLMTMMQLAVPDLKRGRVSSALSALTVAASLLSMAAAAATGEVVALRAIYVAAGLITVAGGVVGLLVLQEPQPDDTKLGTESAGLAETGPTDENISQMEKQSTSARAVNRLRVRGGGLSNDDDGRTDADLEHGGGRYDFRR
jgi:hypothetical protein